MTEVLGEAVLDLTADLAPLARKLEEAKVMTRSALDDMAREVATFDAKLAAEGQALDRVFLNPLERSLVAAGSAADVFTGSLDALQATVGSLEGGLRELERTVMGTSSAFTEAQGRIAQSAVETASVVVASQKAEKAAIEDTTQAMLQQAAVAGALSGGPAPFRELRQAFAGGRYYGEGRSLPNMGPGPISQAQIWGSRGNAAPGSINNPVVVAIEAGQYAGMGARGWPAPGSPGYGQPVSIAGAGPTDASTMVGLLRGINDQLSQQQPAPPPTIIEQSALSQGPPPPIQITSVSPMRWIRLRTPVQPNSSS